MSSVAGETSPPSRRWPGYFIAIEGIDGTGKSTLAGMIGEELERRGVPHLVSREPTDGPHGRRIRELAKEGRDSVSPEEEMELFIDDRKAHVVETILPALREGKVVILDRYYYSTMAYQGARGVDPETILERNRAFAPEPDLLVLLDLDVETALERIREARGDRPDHFEGAEYLEKVSDLFDCVEHPNALYLHASDPPEALRDRTMEALNPWLADRAESPRS